MNKAYLSTLTPDERAEYLTVLSTRIGMGFDDIAVSSVPREAVERADAEARGYVEAMRENKSK